MNKYLAFCSGVTFRRFEIRIRAEQSTLFEAWPGAVLRNNLLFAAAQVDVPEEGMTLFEYACKRLPLLRCIEQLGVGEKLSYGFGKVRVEEK